LQIWHKTGSYQIFIEDLIRNIIKITVVYRYFSCSFANRTFDSSTLENLIPLVNNFKEEKKRKFGGGRSGLWARCFTMCHPKDINFWFVTCVVWNSTFCGVTHSLLLILLFFRSLCLRITFWRFRCYIGCVYFPLKGKFIWTIYFQTPKTVATIFWKDMTVFEIF